MKDTPIINLLNDIYYYYYNKYLADEIQDYEWYAYKKSKEDITYWLKRYDKDTTKNAKNEENNKYRQQPNDTEKNISI